MDNQATDKTIDSTENKKVLSKENRCDIINNDSSTNNNQQEVSEKQEYLTKVTLKQFFMMKSVFTDFINGYYYDGEKVITEDMVEVSEQKGYLVAEGNMLSVDRDVYMIIKNDEGQVIASVGIQNQTEVDDKMSASVSGYDGASLLDQYENDKNEMHCVNTIIINYSSTEWGNTSLKDDIPKRDGDEIFREKMIDSELNIVNLKSLTPKKIKQYGNRDLRMFFEIVHDIISNKNEDDKEIISKIIKEDNIVVNYPSLTAIAIKAVTNRDAYVNLVEQYKDKVCYTEGEQVKLSDVLGNYMKTKDAEIAKKDNALAEKDNTIAEKDNALAEKDNTIAEKDNALAEKDNALAEKDNALAEKDNALAEKDTTIAEKDTNFVTYLVKDNKSNEEIKKIVTDVTDDFINKVRESVVAE